MKNRLFTLIAITLLVLLSGCSSDDEVKSTALVFTPSVSISNSETLRYSLGQFGDPELTTILYQAKNAEISELRTHPETGEIYYFYKPEAGFIGHDHVQLRTESGPLGSPESTTVMQANITIEISF